MARLIEPDHQRRLRRMIRILAGVWERQHAAPAVVEPNPHPPESIQTAHREGA